MSSRAGKFIEGMRKQAYTGENRCVPCTVVNVVIALFASVLVAILAVELAVVGFVLALAAIYLRGYLIPGTPTLTRRYLPDRVLSMFDTHPVEQRRVDEEQASDEEQAGEQEEWETIEALEYRRENAVDPETFLLEVGAVEPCKDEEDLCFTDEFTRRLDREVDADDGESIDREAMADLLDTDAASLNVRDREYPALDADRRVRTWPSTAALRADIATDNALERLTDRWSAVPLEQRLGIVKSMRSFYERCPLCSGVIELSDGTVESCCRSYEVVAVRCRECGDALLEFEPEETTPEADQTGITR